MKKSEKAKFVLKELQKLYPEPSIPLNHKDPFTLLVSVLLSAQCTDKKVNKITPILFNLAHDPYEMAKLPVAKIKNIIHPCGLSNRKSIALHELSKILTQNFNGGVPNNIRDLESLPGVGHKTASVVMVQAFEKKAFPVDTHIHRLLFRWGLTNGKNVVQTEYDAKRIFPPSSWAALHLQLIYYGREHCPARGHRQENCLICSKIGVKSRM